MEVELRILLLILREMFHRKTHFFLGFMAIFTAVSLIVAFITAGEASKRETTRLMRDLGYNLRIIPGNTDMEDFWKDGFSKFSMPESCVQKLSSYAGLSISHLTPVLQKNITWREKELILTGLGPEASSPGKKKSPMVYSIDPGTIFMGHELAKALILKPGETVNISGHDFRIVKCLSESGSLDDIRIFACLEDVQRLLKMDGRINEIKALKCLCPVGSGGETTSLQALRDQVGLVLPDTKVLLMQTIASTRERQRAMAEMYFNLVCPIIILACMIWIGVIAWVNVRERTREIGIFRALGFSSFEVASLFLGRAVLVGLIGAAIGFGAGTILALGLGPQVFHVTAKKIAPEFSLIFLSLGIAPVICAISTFIPSMLAVVKDPAVTLRRS